EHKTALTTKQLSDQFKWSSQAIRKALASLGIVEKGLVNSIKVDGRTQRVIFFDPTRLEKRLREFIVNYKPNTVTEVTGVTDSKPSVQDSPLFNCGTKSDVPH
ncbi:MAG: hypothetical protein M1490_04870, partial [Candidatus Bathyarchaeota archaeon]|nr:hypothetical protein [Candidatus Bathyarchaeota archaeon]